MKFVNKEAVSRSRCNTSKAIAFMQLGFIVRLFNYFEINPERILNGYTFFFCTRNSQKLKLIKSKISSKTFCFHQ